MTFPAGIAAKAVSGQAARPTSTPASYDRSGDAPIPRSSRRAARASTRPTVIVCVSHYTAGDRARADRVDAGRGSASSTTRSRSREQRRGLARRARRRPARRALPGARHVPEGPRSTSSRPPRAWSRVLPARPLRDGGQRRHAAAHDRARGVAGARAPRALHRLPAGRGRRAHVRRWPTSTSCPRCSEPFGIAPLEAMALDVPVIVSRAERRRRGAHERARRSTSGTSRTSPTRSSRCSGVPALRDACSRAEGARGGSTTLTVGAARPRAARRLRGGLRAMTSRRPLLPGPPAVPAARATRSSTSASTRTGSTTRRTSASCAASPSAATCRRTPLLLRLVERTRGALPLRVLDQRHRARPDGARGRPRRSRASSALARDRGCVEFLGRDVAPLARRS